MPPNPVFCRAVSVERSALICLLAGAEIPIAAPAIAPAQTPLEGPGSGLVAWWQFDEPSGHTVADSSETADHTGLLIGSPTRTAGISGGAIRFNGVTDLIRIPQSPSLFLGTKTIAVWARVDDFLRLYTGFFGWGRGPAAIDNYHGYSRYNGMVYASYLNGAGTEIIRNNVLAPAGTVKLGQWAHFAFVRATDCAWSPDGCPSSSRGPLRMTANRGP
jgi:hypothetical protein